MMSSLLPPCRRVRRLLRHRRRPLLQPHTCPWYGVCENVDLLLAQHCYPHGLCLGLLPGSTMWDAYQTLPPADDRRRLYRLLRETVQLLHDDAGVCHGEIKEYNVIIHGTDAWLIDFGSASLRARLLDKTWSQCKQQDITCLDAMFLAADSRDMGKDQPSLTSSHCY